MASKYLVAVLDTTNEIILSLPLVSKGTALQAARAYKRRPWIVVYTPNNATAGLLKSLLEIPCQECTISCTRFYGHVKTHTENHGGTVIAYGNLEPQRLDVTQEKRKLVPKFNNLVNQLGLLNPHLPVDKIKGIILEYINQE